MFAELSDCLSDDDLIILGDEKALLRRERKVALEFLEVNQFGDASDDFSYQD